MPTQMEMDELSDETILSCVEAAASAAGQAPPRDAVLPVITYGQVARVRAAARALDASRRLVGVQVLQARVVAALTGAELDDECAERSGNEIDVYLGDTSTYAVELKRLRKNARLRDARKRKREGAAAAPPPLPPAECAEVVACQNKVYVCRWGATPLDAPGAGVNRRCE